MACALSSHALFPWNVKAFQTPSYIARMHSWIFTSVSYLLAISRPNGDNLGGILSIQVARKENIISIPAPVAGVIYGDIEFQAGFGWLTWDVTLESAQISSGDRNTREGFSSVNGLPFRIPKDVAGIKHMLNLAAEDEFIVLFTDPNGKKKIFGLLESPVKFTVSHDGGRSLPDGSFFEGKFYYEGPDNIFFYEGEIEAAPAGAAPAIVKFNGVPISALTPGQTLNIISEFGFTSFYTTG